MLPIDLHVYYYNYACCVVSILMHFLAHSNIMLSLGPNAWSRHLLAVFFEARSAAIDLISIRERERVGILSLLPTCDPL